MNTKLRNALALSFISLLAASAGAQTCRLVCDLNGSRSGILGWTIPTPVWGNTLLFAAKDRNGIEPHAINTVTGKCQQIADINPRGDSQPRGFTACGDKVYFGASATANAWLHEWDGTTLRRYDIEVESSFVSSNNRLYFGGNDGKIGFELWTLDPAAPDATRKPVLVKDLNPGAAGSSPK